MNEHKECGSLAARRACLCAVVQAWCVIFQKLVAGRFSSRSKRRVTVAGTHLCRDQKKPPRSELPAAESHWLGEATSNPFQKGSSPAGPFCASHTTPDQLPELLDAIVMNYTSLRYARAFDQA